MLKDTCTIKLTNHRIEYPESEGTHKDHHNANVQELKYVVLYINTSSFILCTCSEEAGRYYNYPSFKYELFNL